MRLMEPLTGEDIADCCRRIYHETFYTDEPILFHFNDTTIIFVKDEKGYHYKGSDINTAEITYFQGETEKEWMERERRKRDSSTSARGGGEE